MEGKYKGGGVCLNCRVSIIFSLCFITHKLHLPFTGDDGGGGGGCGYDGLAIAMLALMLLSLSVHRHILFVSLFTSIKSSTVQ